VLLYESNPNPKSYPVHIPNLTPNKGDVVARQLEGERERAREMLREREADFNDQKEAFKNLDEERDRLQSLLDNEQERNVRDNLVRQKQQTDIVQLRQILERTEKQTESFKQEVTALQRQAASAEARIKTLKEESLELKRRLKQKHSEIGGASEDLMLMTRENQALTSELAETTSERDLLHRKAAEMARSLAGRDQHSRGLEVEREDLLSSYRAVLQEKRTLEADLLGLSAIKEKAGLNIQQLKDEVNELRVTLKSQEQSQQKWHVERSSNTRQVERMNDELVRAQRALEVQAAESRRVVQESHGLQSTNSMLAERVQMVIKRATAAADANKVLSVRLAAVERERDAVRAVVAVERQRASDMERVAEGARAQTAATDVQLQRMRHHSVGSNFSSSASLATQAVKSSLSSFSPISPKYRDQPSADPNPRVSPPINIDPKPRTSPPLKTSNISVASSGGSDHNGNISTNERIGSDMGNRDHPSNVRNISATADVSNTNDVVAGNVSAVNTLDAVKSSPSASSESGSAGSRSSGSSQVTTT
jgi:hypothetical protein